MNSILAHQTLPNHHGLVSIGTKRSSVSRHLQPKAHSNVFLHAETLKKRRACQQCLVSIHKTNDDNRNNPEESFVTTMINVEKLSTALIHQTREIGLAILQSQLKVGSRLIASKHPLQDPRKGWSDLNVWRRKLTLVESNCNPVLRPSLLLFNFHPWILWRNWAKGCSSKSLRLCKLCIKEVCKHHA